MNRRFALLACLLLALAPAGRAAAEEAAKAAYPLDVCLVSGEKLGAHGEPYVLQHEGREVRLCCKMCVKDFKKDLATYLKQIDDAAKKMAEGTAAPAAEPAQPNPSDAHQHAQE